MKKHLITLLFVFISAFLAAQVEVTIYEIQGQQDHSPYDGQIITTNGIVTGVFNGSYFIQDGEGAWNGVYVYASNNVSLGDEVALTAEVDEYYDLTELKNVSSFVVLSSGNPLPEPTVLSTQEINDEAYEGVLVKVENAVCTNDDIGYGEWELDDGSGACVIDDLGVVYTPTAGLNYTVTGPLYYSFEFYKIEPRDESDIIIEESLYFTSEPVQINPDKTSITLSWETNVEASTELFWGTTPALGGGHISLPGNSVLHEIQLTGSINPSSIYYLRAFSVAGTDTTPDLTRPYATVSNSTGEIKLYFNHKVDHSVATEEWAVWTPTIADTVIHYIDMAQQTLDITMYEQESEAIVEAINNAYDRGVVVRYITDDNGNNPSLENLNQNIPVLYGNTEGIMHDKFIIIDAEEEMGAWLITGSLNHTVNNLGWDYNNMICIQDKSMALGFTLEFNEMWGSDGPMYNETNAKFGAEKTDNTPHLFLIDSVLMEAYFSPSDNTTDHIKAAIDQAESEIEFGMMVFTENSLGNAIVNAQENGLDILGIIDYIEYTGSEYQYLKDHGVNVLEYANPDGSQWPDGPVFHHKYALMDFEDGAASPVVITGSHNWSASAESINDENTLVIYDANLANQFHQEFTQRYNDLLTPIAADDDTVALTYEWVHIHYMDNDFVPEGVQAATEFVQLPSNGEAEWADGNMMYRSDNDFFGTDSLSYRIYNTDLTWLADTAWVRIEVSTNSIDEKNSDNFTLQYASFQHGSLQLQMHSKQPEKIRCSLIDISGRLMLDENRNLTNGINAIQLHIPSISKGVFIINISGSSGSISSKLVY